MTLCLVKKVIFVAGLLIGSFLFSESWPNWLGPNHSGALEEGKISMPSKDQEYPRLWIKQVGEGWSAPVISEDKVILHDRFKANERIICLKLQSGEVLWTFTQQATFRDDFGMSDGPRSTPSISGGMVVTHSPAGIISCLSLENGEITWTRNVVKDYQSPKGFFGRCSSPLVLGEKVIIGVGGQKAGLVALSLEHGKTLWESPARNVSYASCVPFRTQENKVYVLSFLRDGFSIVDADTGKENFFSPFRSSIDASVNAATPLIMGRKIFLSACYGVGSALWQFPTSPKTNESLKMKLLWKRQESLDCHFSTPVEYRNYIFGFHGRQERGSVLRCVRLSDGKVMWTEPTTGSGNLIRVGEQVICLTETGELIVFGANSDQLKIDFTQQVLGPTRAHFAYSKGKIVARDNRRMVCLDLQ